MNLGNIPGYYWDEEKKKYFKITADHAVESRQKYTKSNVRHEKQVAKRRKIEQREQEKRQAQTIKRMQMMLLSPNCATRMCLRRKSTYLSSTHTRARCLTEHL
jgi:hypothetical protein